MDDQAANHSLEEQHYLLEAIDALQRELVVISPHQKVLAANQFSKDKYGADMVGQSCYQLYFSRSKPCERCPVHEALRPGHLSNDTDLDGSLKLEEGVICYPIVRHGKLEALVRLDFDLPKLGRLEKKLERSNAFLHNLILSSVDAVIAADKNGSILVFNNAASEILGYRREEALRGLDIRDIYQDGQAKEIMRKLRSSEYGGPGKLKAYRVELLSKDGEEIPVSLDASIIYENGREVATIGFFHDLRETLKMEKELEETRIQLFQSAKMAALGKLAAGVAHQINNPLGGIGLFAQLLLEEYNLEENARQDVQRILDDTQRCKETVKELLEFARQSTYKTKAQDINRALSRTLFLLEKHTIFQNIEIVQQLDPNLPPVPCDLQQMSHVFMNLILNAAEAMEGSGRLAVNTVQKSEGWIRIGIADTGPGIPEDILPKIFDPFYTTKEEGKGTGLGLSVAFRIVQNHGGKLWVQNTDGGGAEFVIELPMTADEGAGSDVQE
jgi:PAS domain S-box-containing protein